MVIPTKPESKPSSSTPTTNNRGGTIKNSTSRNRDIKCFKCQGRGHIGSQCPNTRTILMRPDSEYETDEEEEKNHGEELEVEEVQETLGLVAVTRRALSTQARNEDDAQQENIFYARCKVKEKVYSLIIDGVPIQSVSSNKKTIDNTSSRYEDRINWYQSSERGLGGEAISTDDRASPTLPIAVVQR